jgi:hypothetical protein
MYFIKPNIFLTDNALKQFNKFYIKDEEMQAVINNCDHSCTLEYNSYRKTKKFYDSSIMIYAKWLDDKKEWKVSSCFKFAKK